MQHIFLFICEFKNIIPGIHFFIFLGCGSIFIRNARLTETLWSFSSSFTPQIFIYY